MVKCMLDGELVVLGGPNLLEAGYYSNHLEKKKPPRRHGVIQQYPSIQELARDCKVVDELFDNNGIPRLKIVYIPCLDWSNKSQRMIVSLIDQFRYSLRLEFTSKYHWSKTNSHIKPPKIISVVQDKDYWPGSEFEDPLVLERRAAKEKEYKESPQKTDGFKPDCKIVKHHVMVPNHANSLIKEKTSPSTYLKKMKHLPSAQPYSLERYLSECVHENFGFKYEDEDDDYVIDDTYYRSKQYFIDIQEYRNRNVVVDGAQPSSSKRYLPGSVVFALMKKHSKTRSCLENRENTPPALVEEKEQLPSAQPPMPKECSKTRSCLENRENTPPPALVEEKEQLPSAQPPMLKKCSNDHSNLEMFKKEKTTPLTLVDGEKQLLSAQSSSLKRSRPDSDGGFFFDFPIPKKSRYFGRKLSNADE